MIATQLQVEGPSLHEAASALKAMYWVLFGERSDWFDAGLTEPAETGAYEVLLSYGVVSRPVVRYFDRDHGWNEMGVRQWRGLKEKPL